MAKNTVTILTAGILACCVTVAGNAEITGSGIRSLECDGQLDLNLWVDSNENGLYDNAESGVPEAKLILSVVGAPELGIEIITVDLSGVVQIGSLCQGQYALQVEGDSIPDTISFGGAYESGVLLNLPAEGPGVSVALTDGDDETSPGQRQIDMAFNEFACDIEAVASCGVASVAVGEISDYTCEKPVSELSLVWSGEQAVRVVAHAGNLDKPVIADFDHVVPGQVVTVAGLENSGNDLIWEIFEAGSDIKVGESSFHLSCSDGSMNGLEDCGLPAGDGKNNDKCTDDDCINDWLFAGLIDKHNTIQCLSTVEMTTAANCSIYRDSPYAVRYRVTNNTAESVGLSAIVENVSSPDDVEIPLVASQQQVEFAWFGQATEDVTRLFSAQSGVSGLSCGVESIAVVSVMELPPACDAVEVTLRDLSHDKFKLRFTNAGERELGLTQYQLTWPQEHETLVEVKWGGAKIYEQDLAWQAVTVHGVADFLPGAADRLIPAEDFIEMEFKFDQHVHNTPQTYELEFAFDTDCSIVYSITP